MNPSNTDTSKILRAMETFRIEIPSWGFANTGTRFGKFQQPAAAATTEEKFSDAGEVHRLTGGCPTIALHVLWDCPEGTGSAKEITELSARYGIRPGSINPNLFQDQIYKYGSFGNPNPSIRSRALQHAKESIEIARLLHLSVRTVEQHRAHVLRKLQVKNQTELICYALRRGIIALED